MTRERAPGAAMTLREIERALRLAAHALGERPEWLPSQLAGRLPRDRPELAVVFDDLRGYRRRAWLRPAAPSLAAAAGALLFTDARHGAPVLALALLDGDRAVLSADASGVLRLWWLDSGREISRFTADSDGLRCVSVGEGGHTVAVLGAAGGVALWDPRAGELVAALGEPRAAATHLALRDADRSLAIGDAEGGVTIWTPPQRPRRLGAHRSRVGALCRLPDGRVISGSEGGEVVAWDPATGGRRLLLKRREPVASLVATAEGRLFVGVDLDRSELATWTEDRPGGDPRISVHELDSGREVARLPGHGSILEGQQAFYTWFSGFALSATRAIVVGTDGGSIFSGGSDSRVLRHELDPGAGAASPFDPTNAPILLDRLVADRSRRSAVHGARVNALALTADGERLLSVSDDGTIKIWSISRWCDGDAAVPHHATRVAAVALSGDAKGAASGDDAGRIRFWEVESGDCRREIEAAQPNPPYADIPYRALELAWPGNAAAPLQSLGAAPLGAVARFRWAPESGARSAFAFTASWESGVREPPPGEYLLARDGRAILELAIDGCWLWRLEETELGLAGEAAERVEETLRSLGDFVVRADRLLPDRTICRFPRASPGHRLGRDELRPEAPDRRNRRWFAPAPRPRVAEPVERLESLLRRGYSGPLVLEVDDELRVAHALLGIQPREIRLPWYEARRGQRRIGNSGSTARALRGRVRIVDCDCAGRRLLVADLAVGKLAIWELGEDRAALDLDLGASIVDCAPTPDFTRVAVAFESGEVGLWDLARGERIASFRCEATASAIALGSDGETLAVGEASGRVHLLRLMR